MKRTGLAWLGVVGISAAALAVAEGTGLLRVGVGFLAALLLLNAALTGVAAVYWGTQFPDEAGWMRRVATLQATPACLYVIPLTFGAFGSVLSARYREELEGSIASGYALLPVWALAFGLVVWLARGGSRRAE